MIEESASKVSIVIPCYNEARRLNVAAFREFLSREPDRRLLFVDDGSRDRTLQMLRDVTSGFERSAVVLSCGWNRGKAEAVRLGILHALDQFQPQSVGYWDADLATPLDAIDRFVDVLHQHPAIDMVFGARVQLLGRKVQRRAGRHYLGRIFATAVSSVLRLAIYDTQCGAKLFRVAPETRRIFAEPFLSKWVFDVEILARYQQLYRSRQEILAHAVYEYPLEQWTDVAGSKVHPGDFFVALWDVLRIWRKYLR